MGIKELNKLKKEKIIMENEKYNGWTNRDTWLVMLWLNNDEKNYRRLLHIVNGIGVSKRLRDLTDIELLEKLKTFNYGDEINWNKVNLTELKEIILEDYEEQE